MAILAAVGLIALATILYILYALKIIKNEGMSVLANICQVVSLIAAALIFVVPTSAGSASTSTTPSLGPGQSTQPNLPVTNASSATVTIDANTTLSVFEGRLSISLLRSGIILFDSAYSADLAISSPGVSSRSYKWVKLGESNFYEGKEVYEIRITRFSTAKESVEMTVTVLPRRPSFLAGIVENQPLVPVAGVLVLVILGVGNVWLMHTYFGRLARQWFLGWLLGAMVFGLFAVMVFSADAGIAFLFASLLYAVLSFSYMALVPVLDRYFPLRR